MPFVEHLFHEHMRHNLIEVKREPSSEIKNSITYDTMFASFNHGLVT